MSESDALSQCKYQLQQAYDAGERQGNLMVLAEKKSKRYEEALRSICNANIHGSTREECFKKAAQLQTIAEKAIGTR